MQFGIGLLGRGWSVEGQRAWVRTITSPPRKNFDRLAHKYAGKIAGMTLFADTPTEPDLTDDGIVELCATCSSPVRPSEAPLVRQAFIHDYLMLDIPTPGGNA